MSRLRISAISYLNTAPLLWDFERTTSAADFRLSYTIPSACAEALRDGTVDVGIIPAAAYASIPDLLVIPEVAIAARRAIRSILLVSRVPVERIRTVALDTSSLTSVALAKILFAKWSGGKRRYQAMAPNLERMLKTCDAAVLIGDPALQIDRSRFITLDLAEEWIARTGKPFVFAFWAIRRKTLEGRKAAAIAKVFQQSRAHGLEPANLEAIVQDWAPKLNLPPAEVRTYLTHNIHYYLDPPCLDGLRLFYCYAAEIGAIPRVPGLEFAL